MERTKYRCYWKAEISLYTPTKIHTLNVLLFSFFLYLFCFYQIETTRNKKEIIHTHCTFCTRSDLLYCRHHHHTRFPVERARERSVSCGLISWSIEFSILWCVLLLLLLQLLLVWLGLVGFAYVRFCLLITGKRASFLFDWQTPCED